LIGTPYWNATSVAGIIGQVLYEPMAPPSERGCVLGPEFDAWFLRACHREAAQRFTSAIEQVESLAVVLGLPTAEHRVDGLRSNPGASADGFSGASGPARVSPGDSRSGAETIAQSGNTLVSSSSTAGRAPQPRRKAVLYTMISAAVVFFIAGAMFYKREPPPPSSVLATPAAAAAIAPAQPTLAAAPPSPPPTSSIAAIGEAPTKVVTATAAPTPASLVGKRKDAPKPSPARSAPASNPVREHTGSDPLGDQK
jgi:eukaryotic-like serine/threonine-protein kinase